MNDEHTADYDRRRIAWNIFDLSRIVAVLLLLLGVALDWSNWTIAGLMGYVIVGLVLSMWERYTRPLSPKGSDAE